MTIIDIIQEFKELQNDIYSQLQTIICKKYKINGYVTEVEIHGECLAIIFQQEGMYQKQIYTIPILDVIETYNKQENKTVKELREMDFILNDIVNIHGKKYEL